MKRSVEIIAGALCLMMFSCSQEDVVAPAQGGEGNYNITVNLPKEFATRAIGNGLTATTLNVVLYDTEDNAYITTQTVDFESNSLSTTVSFNLITGKSYEMVFFAASPAALVATAPVYQIDNATGILSVNYANMTSQDNAADAYDCFYNLYSTGTITKEPQNISVTLHRPVAQINWGSNDLDDPTVTSNATYGTNAAYLRATLTTEAYSTLNLLTGEVGNQETITITNFAAPTGAYPISGYDYVGLFYLLAPAESSAVYDLNLDINNSANTTATQISQPIDVSSAPVQANYQTNIYGTLLTTGATFNVTKNAAWSTPGFSESLTWNGTTVTQPDVDDQAKTVTVNRPSDLAGLAQMVTGGNALEGYTVTLTNDYDLGGFTFAGIGNATRSGNTTSSANAFRGTFDGQGHTISNLVLAGTNNADDAIGFIPNLDGPDAIVKNVNFEGIAINAPNNEQAAVVGIVTNGATIDGVTVSSGSVTSKEAAAGVVGRVLAHGTVKNCSNSASITSDTNAAGIVGAAYYTQTGATMTVANCTNNGDITGTSQAVGGVVGLSAANVSSCTNNGTVTGGTTATGGIVGQQNCYGTVSDCTNTGVVKGGSGYGTGGIVGWVRYNGTLNAYEVMDVINITGCKNTASISGSTGVGGIVGIWYMAGVCNNNTNTAAKITATNQFVAGIIGAQQWTETGPQGGSVTGDTNMLYVQDNISTTPMSDISGGSSGQYIYVNDQAHITLSGNTNVLK